MNTYMKTGFWRTDYQTVSGFSQFCRDWQPRDESCLPVLALHGSLTQSGMWIALADTARTVRMLCPDQRGFGRSEDPAVIPARSSPLMHLRSHRACCRSATWSWVTRSPARSHLR